MNIKAIRSDEIYRKMMSASGEEKENLYRYELMKPFEFKWQCVGIPLKSETEGGYDVVSAAGMGGDYTPAEITAERSEEIEKISDNGFWNDCEGSIRNALEGFEKHGIVLPTQDYTFTVILNNPNKPMSALAGDVCGEGGIPGYIIGSIIPNEKSLKMLPVALAHEANHNVRWQFMKWSQNVTLADMMVSEGLAENFAAYMFGEDKIGKWVTETSTATLETVVKPMIKGNLAESDFNRLSSFLYGDEIMTVRGGTAIGMPFCGGYACGYALVRYYLEKTGKSIFEATVLPTDEIIKETEDFWK